MSDDDGRNLAYYEDETDACHERIGKLRTALTRIRDEEGDGLAWAQNVADDALQEDDQQQ
jgi:hypothetical protein